MALAITFQAAREEEEAVEAAVEATEATGRWRQAGLPAAAAPRLLDLPPEVRLLILEHCPSFREVARLRTVCHAFDLTCNHIIKSGFVRMQEQVLARVGALERQAEALLQTVTSDPTAPCCAARRHLQRNLQRQQHLRLLSFQLQLVRALTWRYVEAGVVAPPYAMLLDTCDALLWGGERGQLRPRAHVHTCRNVAMRLLKNFLRHVQERLPPPARPLPPKATRFAVVPACASATPDVVLPCCSVIDLLEASLGPRPRGSCYGFKRVAFRPAGTHCVRVQACYDLEGCWLGVYSGNSPHGALFAHDVHLLSSILCDLVCSSSEARLLGLREPDPDRADGEHQAAANVIAAAAAAASGTDKSPGFIRGRPPFCVYPRLHNPRQCYRGSIREPSGRVFLFGHAPSQRQGLRVFLDLTASVALVPASLLRRLTPDAAAQLPPPSPCRGGDGPLTASASEPFIPKIASHLAKDPASSTTSQRPLPFEMELVFESNTDRVVYRTND